MERTPAPNVIRFPAFDRGLDDGDSNVVSIFNAKPLPCDFDSRPDPYAGLEEAARRAAVEADCRRDIRYIRWQGRVTALCIVVFYLVLFIVCFQLGRAF
jgi:hypothetical protein